MEDVAGSPEQLLARRAMVRESGPGQEKRTLLVQQQRFNGRDRAGGVAEGHHHAAGPQAVQGAHER